MNKKRKIFSIILIFLIVLLVVISCFVFGYVQSISNNKEEKSLTTTNTGKKIPELVVIDTVDMCMEKENCSIVGTNVYSNLVFQFDDEEMQQWIQQINEETNKYYQESIMSTTDDEDCASIRDIYNYKISTQTYYSNFVNNSYVSLAVQRVSLNLCTNESKEVPIQVYLYSKKKKKKITQDELKEELNLTEDVIKEAIEKNIESLFTEVPADFDYSDYTLYYDSTGCLLAEYYLSLNNHYYSATILY